LIEHLGDRVEELELSAAAEDAFEWHRLIMEAEMAASLEREWTEGRDRLAPSPAAPLGPGPPVAALRYLPGPAPAPRPHAGPAPRARRGPRPALRPACRGDPAPGRQRHRPPGAGLDGGSGLLHAVDADRPAGAQPAADAGRERPAARRPAGRAPARRRAAS